MRKPTATAPSVPLGRKMNPSKTSPQAKTDPPAKVSRPVKTSHPEKTSHRAKASSPAPQPKPAVTAVEMGAQHMRKPSKKAPPAKRGQKLSPSKGSPAAETSPPAKANPPAKTSPAAKTSPPAPQPKSAVTAVEMGARHMRKPSKKSPSAKHGRKSKPSKTSPPVKTSPPAPQPKPAVTAEEMGARQREISVSEFFTKNRHLLGFDNPRKALLTCVKEGVDNALDACEEAGILPEVVVKVEAVANGETPPPPTQASRFRITVSDNGPGIVRQQIPKIFAKLLYGSKFHRLRMSRGQQGLGISAAGMYGQMTTGKPVQITSRTSARAPAHYFEVQIDTKKSEPLILEKKQIAWEFPRGTQVTMEVEGRYQKGRASVDEYVEQTIIANPHVKLTYATPEGETKEHPRTYPQLPPSPREIKPHPYGIELGMLLKMLQDTKSHWLSGFLAGDFSRVSPRLAEDICKAAGLSPRARPRDAHGQASETLYKAIQSTKIMAPPTNCLSPVGEKAILSGLYQQIKGEFYTAVSRPPAVYRRNHFIIEEGLAYGLGSDQEPPAEA